LRYSDSKLVVNKLNGKWHIRADRLRELFDRIYNILNERKIKVKFAWIRSKDNYAHIYLGSTHR
jgi:ribonuclease HI